MCVHVTHHNILRTRGNNVKNQNAERVVIKKFHPLISKFQKFLIGPLNNIPHTHMNTKYFT